MKYTLEMLIWSLNIILVLCLYILLTQGWRHFSWTISPRYHYALGIQHIATCKLLCVNLDGYYTEQQMERKCSMVLYFFYFDMKLR